MGIGMLRRHHRATAEARKPKPLSKMLKADLVAEAKRLGLDHEGVNVKALRKAVGKARKAEG